MKNSYYVALSIPVTKVLIPKIKVTQWNTVLRGADNSWQVLLRINVVFILQLRVHLFAYTR